MSGSLKSIISLLAAGMMLASGLGWVLPTAAQAAEGEPDLPAMVLRTWDIADAGFEEQLFSYGGQCAGVDQQAVYLSTRTGIEAETLIEDLTNEGLISTCRQVYAELEEGDATDRQPVKLIISSVTHFEDEKGARNGFDMLTDERLSPNAGDIPAGEEYSRDSEATLLTLSDSVGEFTELELTFRLDNLIATVSLRNYSAEAPEYGDDIETLADILTGKIDAALDGASPGFGPLVIGINGYDLLPVANYSYYVFDGETERFSNETPDVYEERVDGYGDASFIMNSTQRIPANALGSKLDVTIGVQLVQLDDEEAASEWIADYVDLKQADPDLFDFIVHDDAPEFGDESITVTHGDSSGSEPIAFERIIGRVGDVVFNVGFAGTMVPFGMADRLAGPQVECLEDGACARPLSLADIFPPEEDEEAEEAATPDAEDDAAATGGETYESDLYPYTLTFDDSWSLEDPSMAGDTEILSMSNGTSSVVIIAGTAHNGDVESCLDAAIDYIADNDDNSDVDTLLDDNGDSVEEYDEDRAFTALSYTSADDADLIVYLECRVLVPGESTIEFNQYTLADDYDDQVNTREDLLDGLDID